MTIIAVGIDLAKHVFAVHGVDEAGRAALVRPSVARDKLHETIATLPPCLIGMEACTGAHHWARLFMQHGHSVRLIAPKFVAPYRLSGKRGKNDAADAQAICEAVQRPQMRFVPVKSEAQQAQLMVHCARQGFVKERTATINRIRGLLAEFGHILAAKADTVRREAAKLLEALPGQSNRVIGDLLSQIHHLDQRIAEYDGLIRTMAREDSRCAELQRLSGLGQITATALRATIGNGAEFKCGRQVAAWLGLVPGQYSSGGKTRLGRITKAGDTYLRTLLVLGARAMLAAAQRAVAEEQENPAKPASQLAHWAVALAARRGHGKAVVAIAAKNARLAWAMLRTGEDFRMPA